VPDAVASPAREMITFYGSSHHQLLEIDAIRRDLGYRDIVGPVEAVRRTVRWIRDNPTAPETLVKLTAFYRIEDQLAKIYGTAAAAAAALDHNEADYHHSYAHPRERGLERDHRDR